MTEEKVSCPASDTRCIKVDELSEGDVIRSPAFRFGYWIGDGTGHQSVCVDGVTRERKETVRAYSEDERLEVAARLGMIPPTHEERETGAYDESRGTALFVVTRINVYKNVEYGRYNGLLGGREETTTWTGLSVTAIRINSDGTCGTETIHFGEQFGCVELVKVLTKKVSYVDEDGRAWFTGPADKLAGSWDRYPWSRHE